MIELPELTYAVGMLDGEGSIGIYEVNNGFALQVSIANTNREVIDWLVNRFGGKVTFTRSGRITKRDRVCFVWKLGARPAHAFLEQCLPFSIVKRDQIICALTYYGEGTHARSWGWGKTTMALEEQERRRAIGLELRRLKHV